jgi:hypothetical protein
VGKKVTRTVDEVLADFVARARRCRGGASAEETVQGWRLAMSLDLKGVLGYALTAMRVGADASESELLAMVWTLGVPREAGTQTIAELEGTYHWKWRDEAEVEKAVEQLAALLARCRPGTKVLDFILGWSMCLSCDIVLLDGRRLPGWHLAAALYPLGRGSCDGDWSFIARAVALFGGSEDSLLAEAHPNDVHHWHWGDGADAARERFALPVTQEALLRVRQAMVAARDKDPGKLIAVTERELEVLAWRATDAAGEQA